MWNMSQESCFWFMLNCTLNTEQCSCPLFILFSGCTYFTFTHTENIHTHSPHFQRIWPLLLAHTPEKHPHFDLKLRVHLFLVTDPGFCPSNSFCICCGNESLFLLWSLLIYRIISFKRKKIWNGKWWPRVLELKSSCFCWSCPSGTSPVSQKASFLFGKSRTMVDVQSDIYLIMAPLWCGAGFERLAICSHGHFGFVILENLTWKMILQSYISLLMFFFS